MRRLHHHRPRPRQLWDTAPRPHPHLLPLQQGDRALWQNCLHLSKDETRFWHLFRAPVSTCSRSGIQRPRRLRGRHRSLLRSRQLQAAEVEVGTSQLRLLRHSWSATRRWETATRRMRTRRNGTRFYSVRVCRGMTSAWFTQGSLSLRCCSDYGRNVRMRTGLYRTHSCSTLVCFHCCV